MTPRGELVVALAVLALIVFLAALGAAINGPS